MSTRLNRSDQRRRKKGTLIVKSLSDEELLEQQLTAVRNSYKKEQTEKNKLLEKERIMLMQLADVKILHHRTQTLKELISSKNQHRVNTMFLFHMKLRETRLKNELRYIEIALDSRILAEKNYASFQRQCSTYNIENDNSVRRFEENLQYSQNNLYNVTIHQPLYDTRCNISINGRSSCNDGLCQYTHNAARANLLCKYEVETMNRCRRDPVPYDSDSILNVALTCPDYDCPLKHFCYVCSYAPSCSCMMVHEHRFNTSKGYLGSVVNQTFHNSRIRNQCSHRFNAAIAMIRNAASGLDSSFCDSTDAYLKCHFECIVQNAGRQSNEKLGFMWQIVGFIFNNCATCSAILDSVVCENSPQTCPNNGVSICEFMNKFKLSTSMPLRHNNPVMSNFDIVLDSDDDDHY